MNIAEVNPSASFVSLSISHNLIWFVVLSSRNSKGGAVAELSQKLVSSL